MLWDYLRYVRAQVAQLRHGDQETMRKAVALLRQQNESIARLTKQRDALLSVCSSLIVVCTTTESNNARAQAFSEALEGIAGIIDDLGPGGPSDPAQEISKRARKIAKALRDGGEGEGLTNDG